MPRKKGKQYPDCWLHEPRDCPTCGKTFRRPRDQKYCSQGCRRFGLGYCDGCGLPFEKRSSNAKYCSANCRKQTTADREALYWRMVRRPKVLKARKARVVLCELAVCGKQIENPYNGQRYHKRCYRKIHNLKTKWSKRLMKKLTDQEYWELSAKALLGEWISDEDWLACHEKAKTDSEQAEMGKFLEDMAKDLLDTRRGLSWDEASTSQKVEALKESQRIFEKSLETLSKRIDE